MQGTAIAAAALCLLVELFQLNARIAADPSPLIEGDIAPFEWAGQHPPCLPLPNAMPPPTHSRGNPCLCTCRAFLHAAPISLLADSKQVPIIVCCNAEYALSALTWAILMVDFIVELNCYVKQRTWLIRFPILFIFAGEIAKLRYGTPLSPQAAAFTFTFCNNTFALHGSRVPTHGMVSAKELLLAAF